MEAVAKLKNVPMSARKMRLVVDIIRGKNVEEALDILRFTKKEAAVWLEKLVLSAIANWEYKLGGAESADEYDLYIETIFADEGIYAQAFSPSSTRAGTPDSQAHLSCDA
jgi:large subunit ribosomal protein L22